MPEFQRRATEPTKSTLKRRGESLVIHHPAGPDRRFPLTVVANQEDNFTPQTEAMRSKIQDGETIQFIGNDTLKVTEEIHLNNEEPHKPGETRPRQTAVDITERELFSS